TASGQNVQTRSYGAYGEPQQNGVGYSINPGASSYPYLYTGQWYDPNFGACGAGLYHYKARFYDPFCGRFGQPDPIGTGDTLNLYG
ncbi:RHS repeat-associated core domain-containing protein, partial [Acinetobacter baumannii]